VKSGSAKANHQVQYGAEIQSEIIVSRRMVCGFSVDK